MRRIVALRIARAAAVSIFRPTGASLMKPFITPERLTSGKLRFPFQCEGIRPEALVDRVKAYRLMAYAVPEGQSAAEAWYLDLRFEDGERLEIMSASTALPN